MSELAEPLPMQDADDAALQLAAATAINRSMRALIQQSACRQSACQQLWACHRHQQPRPVSVSHG